MACWYVFVRTVSFSISSWMPACDHAGPRRGALTALRQLADCACGDCGTLPTARGTAHSRAVRFMPWSHKLPVARRERARSLPASDWRPCKRRRSKHQRVQTAENSSACNARTTHQSARSCPDSSPHLCGRKERRSMGPRPRAPLHRSRQQGQRRRQVLTQVPFRQRGSFPSGCDKRGRVTATSATASARRSQRQCCVLASGLVDEAGPS